MRTVRLSSRGTGVVLGIAALLFVGGIVVAQNSGTARSVEVAFTDASLHGLAIVPASCSSAPPAAPGNPSGYQAANTIPANADVNTTAVTTYQDFCVTNSGGPTYFIPAKTYSEISDFVNAANAGSLAGISVQMDPASLDPAPAPVGGPAD